MFSTVFSVLNHIQYSWALITTGLIGSLLKTAIQEKAPARYPEQMPLLGSIFHFRVFQLPLDIPAAIHDTDNIHLVFSFLRQIKKQDNCPQGKPSSHGCATVHHHTGGNASAFR